MKAFTFSLEVLDQRNSSGLSNVAADETCDIGALHELHRLKKTEAPTVLLQLAKLEKKCFQSYEAFLFDSKLIKQPNTLVLFLTDNALGSPARSIQAYAVCVRFRGAMLLHKICVSELWRGKGVGKYLMSQIMLRAKNMSCRSIELMVDESRIVARHLYSSCGFVELRYIQDYYRVGRHAFKMGLRLES